jgi:ABC-2 type transport system permease protein
VSAETQTPAALELREVRGPSAVGGGSRRFFDLLWLISTTEFKKSFHGTVFGYLWSLVRPLILFGVLLVVFTKIIRFEGEVLHYPELLLLNVVLFGFFQESTGAAVGSVLANEGIVRKTQFPRLVIPFSSVVTAFFTLLLNLVAVFIFILVSGIDPLWTWLLLPVVLLPLALLSTGLSLLLSALNVRFRDVALIWTVLSTVLLYGSPVIYPITLQVLPDTVRDILLVNPLTLILEQARHWIIEPTAPTAVEAAGGWLHVVPASLIFIGACGLGVWVFRREAPKIAERL